MMSPDYVIIGAGTAGCVLAERLVGRGANVLVLEAGGSDRHMHVQIPAAFPKLFKSERDWAFQTEPQANLNGRSIFWPRGKMLGGSSSMNAQIHQWCCARDFEQWSAMGATGWGWQDMRASLERIDTSLNGGPLRGPNPLTQQFLRASEMCGLPQIDSHSGAELAVGAAVATVSHKNGARLNAADAFLRPAMRAGASVLTHAHVQRVLFEGGRAVGVSVCRAGREERISARTGVVLAAGTVNSPHLLMKSGFGDGAMLQAAGIPVVRHAPEVGRNLQDHLMFVAHFAARRPISLKSAESPANLARYLFARGGMLASNIAEATAFVRNDAGAIDLELVFAPALFENEGLSPPSAHGFSIGVVLLTPQSRGRISISGDGFNIDPAYLSARGDLERLVAGVQLAQRIAQTQPLDGENAGERTPASADEADIIAAIRREAHTIYHPVGSCRMGSGDDAVVSPDLRVRGVDGLWVADASIMPTAPRGHPNAVVAAIADRASALIAS